MKTLHVAALTLLLATAGILTAPSASLQAQQSTKPKSGSTTTTNPPKGGTVVTQDSIPPVCPPEKPDCEF